MQQSDTAGGGVDVEYIQLIRPLKVAPLLLASLAASAPS